MKTHLKLSIWLFYGVAGLDSPLCPQLLRGPRVQAWWHSHTHWRHTARTIRCLREKVGFGHKDTVEEVLGNLIFNAEKLKQLENLSTAE